MKVTYQNHMGSDLEVVNCARVSFDGESEWANQLEYECSLDNPRDYPNYKPELKFKDKHLIKFLARGCTTKDWDSLVQTIEDTGYDIAIVGPDLMQELLMQVKRMPSHWVPFANGGQIKMHFKVPLFVARQLQKHTAGFNPWSEVSRRYVDSTPEFYSPDEYRWRSEDKKQGSTGVVTTSCVYDKDGELTHPYYAAEDVNELALQMYHNMIKAKIAPEQARMHLPQSMYTEFVWSGNLYAWASLYNTRSWGDSQAETANVAQQIKAIVEPLFPVSWKELTQ